uniref:Uncharacterized protein n=1 Tax=Romanomermis culicivorax TaxID=13658 RepID=A0A915KR36_ROMCU
MRDSDKLAGNRQFCIQMGGLTGRNLGVGIRGESIASRSKFETKIQRLSWSIVDRELFSSRLSFRKESMENINFDECRKRMQSGRFLEKLSTIEEEENEKGNSELTRNEMRSHSSSAAEKSSVVRLI